MNPPYAELHCLSNFSFQRGASHPEELVTQAAAFGYTAIALTDECSLAGVVRAPGLRDCGGPGALHPGYASCRKNCIFIQLTR